MVLHRLWWLMVSRCREQGREANEGDGHVAFKVVKEAMSCDHVGAGLHSCMVCTGGQGWKPSSVHPGLRNSCGNWNLRASE